MGLETRDYTPCDSSGLNGAMRFLVLGSQKAFFNPTRELIFRGLVRSEDCVVVGPGYGPLMDRVKDYVRKFGKFDGLVVESSIFLTYGTKDLALHWPNANLGTLADMFDYFSQIVVLNLLDDFHGSTRDQFERMFSSRVVVLSSAIGAQNFNPSRFALAKERETWFKGDPRTLPMAIGRNYILFPHAIEDKELATSHGYRSDTVAIPGVQYFIRRRAAKLLKEDGLRVVTGDDLLFRTTRWIVGRTGYCVGLYRGMFTSLLDRSKVAVTCSGTVGYPVRKFFEIPGRGTVLVAEFFDGYEELGFRSGENCFAITRKDGGDVVELVRGVLGDECTRRRLEEAGRELIWGRHRIGQRIRQLVDILEAVADNDFETALWMNGTLRVVRRSAFKAVKEGRGFAGDYEGRGIA